MKLIEEKLDIQNITVMIQKEVADRFMAHEKTKDYGYITLVLKYYFEIKKVCDVSKFAFNPVPKVESSVISFVPRKNKLDVNVESYFKFLKDAFRLKRKNLKNNLNGMYDLEKIQEILEKYGLDLSVRAEELSEEIFFELWKNLNKNS